MRAAASSSTSTEASIARFSRGDRIGASDTGSSGNRAERAATAPPTREPDLGNASGGTLQERSTIIVVSAGKAATSAVARLPLGAVVVAADGGVDTALALGL